MSVRGQARSLLALVPTRIPGPKCTVGASKHLPVILAAVEQGGQYEQIARGLIQKYGADARVAANAISRHIRRECSCHRR